MTNKHRTVAILFLSMSLIQFSIGLPVFAEDKADKPGEVKERGLQRSPVPAAPHYHCGSGVCLCVGQDNCNQMTQPQPCKREKFCLGQTASPPQPLPPQEPALSQQKMQSTARTSSGSIVICSCRAGQ
jgi:hypothetical protein